MMRWQKDMYEHLNESLENPTIIEEVNHGINWINQSCFTYMPEWILEDLDPKELSESSMVWVIRECISGTFYQSTT